MPTTYSGANKHANVIKNCLAGEKKNLRRKNYFKIYTIKISFF